MPCDPTLSKNRCVTRKPSGTGPRKWSAKAENESTPAENPTATPDPGVGARPSNCPGSSLTGRNAGAVSESSRE